MTEVLQPAYFVMLCMLIVVLARAISEVRG